MSDGEYIPSVSAPAARYELFDASDGAPLARAHTVAALGKVALACWGDGVVCVDGRVTLGGEQVGRVERITRERQIELRRMWAAKPMPTYMCTAEQYARGGESGRQSAHRQRARGARR